jgi:hypothetical protein
MKLLFACFMIVLVTWMSFASDERELRGGVLAMLETHIVMSSLISRLILILMFRLAFTLVLCPTLLHMLCLASLMDLTIAHMVLVYERTVESRRFGYGIHPHHGDYFSRRPGFPAGGSYTHLESRHLDGPHFPHHGSHPTRPSGEVQMTVKTSSGRMIKCWISKIYLTNPSTETSTFSHPV